MARLLLNGITLADVDGVLFDKDGTLSHSEPQLIRLGEARIRAAEKLLSQTQQSPSTDSRLVGWLQQAYGLNASGIAPGGLLAVASRQHNLIATATIAALLDHAWPQALLLAEAAFAKADQALANAVEARGDQSSSLLPDAERLLHQLHGAGVRCGVISNDSRQGIERFLQEHRLNAIINEDAIWSADDSPGKPDPLAVHRLCERMQLNHRRCALIGDADSDLLMARDAGVALSLGYVAGWRQPPRLTAHEHLIHHWRNLQVDCLT